MTGGGLFYAKTTMTSGKIENWRSEPGRWSHRIIKSRRKEAKVESLRRSKSVDDDDTIKGIPRGSSTVANYWIPWCDIEPVEFGWNYARAHLPDDVATLLAACDGVEYLSLNSQIKNAIIESLPDWRERVMEVLESIEPEDR